MRKEPLLFLVHDLLLRYCRFLVNADVLAQTTVPAGLVLALELCFSLAFQLFQALVEHLLVGFLLWGWNWVVDVAAEQWLVGLLCAVWCQVLRVVLFQQWWYQAWHWVLWFSSFFFSLECSLLFQTAYADNHEDSQYCQTYQDEKPCVTAFFHTFQVFHLKSIFALTASNCRCQQIIIHCLHTLVAMLTDHLAFYALFAWHKKVRNALACTIDWLWIKAQWWVACLAGSTIAAELASEQWSWAVFTCICIQILCSNTLAFSTNTCLTEPSIYIALGAGVFALTV